MYTQQEMNQFTCCGSPDCDSRSLMMQARCHPKSPTWAIYDKDTGVLTLQCAECEKTVMDILVADNHPITS